jgi:hypothetical protein
MTKTPLPKAYLWREREIKDWNTDTLLAYLKELHKENIGIDYVFGTGGVLREKGMINTFRKAHGNEVTKLFIETCIQSYTPKKDYPNLTFWFMKTYMEGSVLPKLLMRIKEDQDAVKYEEKTKKLSTSEMLDLL